MPLTNYTRHLILAPISGAATVAPLANGLYASLLTTLPTTAGTSAGGANGCAEWSIARKFINDEGTADPQFVRQAGDYGGWELALQGTLEWTNSDTSALGSSVSIVGVALFDNSTGGNLLAWQELAAPRVVSPGGVWTYETDKLRLNLFEDLTDG